MMQVNHTVPDDVLMAYSTGRLPVAFDLVVAAHVSLSDESRARLDAFDTIGGALLEASDTVEVSAGSLDATLALIAAQPDQPVTRRAAPDSIYPTPLHAYIGDEANIVWRPLGMGAKQALLHTEDGATARLLSIPAGAQMPDHGHGGTEMTLVLQGAFRDEFGEFHRGDIEIADEEVEHTPTVIGSETCICLVATDSRLRFNGFLPRLAQHFLRI